MPNNKNIFEGIVSRTKIYLIVIAVLLIIICTLKPKAIPISIAIYIIILLYAIYTNNKRKDEISNHIKELTLSVDNAAKSTLINSPFPLIIIETDGSVIWKSGKFVSTFANIDINNYLNDIVKEIKLKIENNETKQERVINHYVQIGDKTYRIIGEYVKSKVNEKKKQSEYMTILYFIDETEYINYVQKYNDEKICVGIIMIDNYEEIMQRLSVEERLQMVAKVEKEIFEWIKAYEGVVVKSDRDTFACFIEKKYLEKMIENKFSILDEVKQVKKDVRMQSTLSIGISTEGENNYDKYKSAHSAIDIALGRGGDQVVIRDAGKYQFFGGRTEELEKRTKVRARTVSNALEELIQESTDVIIIGHSNADIDAMGSSLGIYRLAKTLNKQAFIVYSKSSVSLDAFMEEVNKLTEYKDIFIDRNTALNKVGENTLLIIVDTHKKNYIEVPEILEKTNKIVIIDHHRKSPDFIDNATLVFHEVYASSAAELVTELIEYSDKNIELTTIEVEALYAGIMVDTKNFTFKTGVRTFEAAAYLRKYGVDIIKVKKWFQSDLETYHKISEIIAKTEIVNDTIGISVYDKQDKDANLICAKAADELLTISDITASFVIGRMGEKICISGRSIGDINVQVILEKLGGGGHITLAGAQVEGMNIDEVRQELINRINEYFFEISN